jgi:hypothetical protein
MAVKFFALSPVMTQEMGRGEIGFYPQGVHILNVQPPVKLRKHRTFTRRAAKQPVPALK